MLNDDEYVDDDNSNDFVQGLAIILEHQKYKTWLYVILLTVCFYILFGITLMATKSREAVIYNTTPDTFEQLYNKHGEILSCPCSRTSVPYRNFTSNNVTMYPICLSNFTSEEWIQALYFENASQYGVWDFRATAYSQVILDPRYIPIEAHEVTDGFNKCSTKTVVTAATLSSIDYESFPSRHRFDMKPMPNSNIVNGFFTGCTPIEALLQSTLNCLYETKCLQLLLDYFLILQQINFNPNNSILPSNNGNLTVNEYLNNVFVRNWSTVIDYKKYFYECSPSLCTYSMIDRTELYYAITLFISLYGGLTIILHLIASCSIDIFMKWKFYSKKQNKQSIKRQRSSIKKFIHKMKQLNLFKNVNDRLEKSIIQQKIITLVYIILLFGSICTLYLCTSLNSETMTITVTDTSMATYNSLNVLYSKTVRCPCSNKVILYQRFVTLSARFHQLCSSDFTNLNWIYLLRDINNMRIHNDWRNRAATQFQLLSDLCRIANTMINDAVQRYLSQLFIVSFVINENDFNKQIKTSLKQFYQSTGYNFGLLTNILQLLLQVDQLYTGVMLAAGMQQEINLIPNKITTDIHTTNLFTVCHCKRNTFT
ncbi:hypothetical protein I4U23_005221 [Adineta vaga]|nr:hypothetical protein I4U23_005221 [Adineta vaga]